MFHKDPCVFTQPLLLAIFQGNKLFLKSECLIFVDIFSSAVFISEEQDLILQDVPVSSPLPLFRKLLSDAFSANQAELKEG